MTDSLLPFLYVAGLWASGLISLIEIIKQKYPQKNIFTKLFVGFAFIMGGIYIFFNSILEKGDDLEDIVGKSSLALLVSLIISFLLTKFTRKPYDENEAVLVTYDSLPINLKSSVSQDDVRFILHLYPANLKKFRLPEIKKGEPMKIDWDRLYAFMASEAVKKGKHLTAKYVSDVINAEDVYLRQIGLIKSGPSNKTESKTFSSNKVFRWAFVGLVIWLVGGIYLGRGFILTPIYQNMGWDYYGKSQYSLALKYFEKASKLSPKDPILYIDICAALLEIKGKAKEAEKACLKSLELNPNDGLAHNNLGYAYVLQGRINEGIMEYKKALEFEPDLKVARENLDALQNRYQE